MTPRRKARISLATGLMSLCLLAPGLPAQAAPRPAHMLTIGDSIIWGQGLKDDQKFREMVRQKLASVLKRNVIPKNLAHSGACMVADPAEKVPDSGEVNFGSPSIRQQFQIFRDDLKKSGISAQDYALVLMDGGINDTDVLTMMSPLDQSSTIRQKVRLFCYFEMRDLLSEIRAALPHARIVVTGYYPVVTSDSSLSLLLENSTLGTRLATTIDPLKATNSAELWEYLTQSGAISRNNSPLLQEEVRTRGGFDYLGNIVDNWAIFAESSNASLQEAVSYVNRSTSGNMISFVDPGFTSVNAVYGPTSYIFPYARPPRDPVAKDREPYCAFFPAGTTNHFTCLNASAGHPNVLGARQYFAKIAPLLDSIPWTPIADGKGRPAAAGRRGR